MTADPGQAGAGRPGPWTFRICVTAACTHCGLIPLDDDTGLTPHFSDPRQAIDELTEDWGWQWTARSPSPAEDELLCPHCQAADPAPDSDGGERAWWEAPGQPRPAMPPNAAVAPRLLRRPS